MQIRSVREAVLDFEQLRFGFVLTGSERHYQEEVIQTVYVVGAHILSFSL